MSVRMPDWLYKQLRECAKREEVSVEQFINSAAAEKLAAMMTEKYLRTRAKRASRAKFEAALRLVSDAEPDPHDRMPAQKSRRRSGNNRAR